ncbi:hypothetical protein GOBAR_DD12158 [Gossypium barbadense]|nr:hypothetical protein GOBAR_DD12158 [Gossypium barbadense]
MAFFGLRCGTPWPTVNAEKERPFSPRCGVLESQALSTREKEGNPQPLSDPNRRRRRSPPTAKPWQVMDERRDVRGRCGWDVANGGGRGVGTAEGPGKFGLLHSVKKFMVKNEIKNLPRGATVIDYAYMIHTDIGNKMVAAKVNGNLVSPTHVLANAEVVEIITYNSSSSVSSHCFDNHGIRGSPTSTVIGPSKHRHSTLGDPNFVENYFKPWEESLRDAHEFGKLGKKVWNAFNETCRAKMVQQTALYFLLPGNVYGHRQV